VLQIVFNEISAAELSGLGTLEQLELLEEFRVSRDDLENLNGERFGKIERDGRVLYRFRAKDYRFYFEVRDGLVIVHRVLHRGTFSDFLFRSKLPVAEDEALAESKHFWKLIDEGRNARRL
jgi:mRNA-degrading endonuclease RelE of RelBE toxin-antitoxin system